MIKKLLLLIGLLTVLGNGYLHAQDPATGYVSSVNYGYTGGRLTEVNAKIVPYIGSDSITDTIIIKCNSVDDCVRYQYMGQDNSGEDYNSYLKCIEMIDLSKISAANNMVDKLEYAFKNWLKVNSTIEIVFEVGPLPDSETLEHLKGGFDGYAKQIGVGLPLYDDLRVLVTSNNGSITIIMDDD